MEAKDYMKFNKTTGRYEYVYSSAAPKIEPETEPNLKPVKKVNKKAVKKEAVAAKTKRRYGTMNFAGVVMMIFCVCVLSMFLVQYIDKQAELHTESSIVSALEDEYNSLKSFNDDLEVRVASNIDNEQIKNIAINNLGMKLAEKNQVYTYTVSSADYMRRIITD